MKKSHPFGAYRAGIFLLGLILSTNAAAFLVNINGVTDTNDNPQTILMSAGTYQVTPINISQGGAYEGWQAYAGAWLWVFNIRAPSFPDLAFGNGTLYGSSLDAFNGSSEGGLFTLTSDESVLFSIGDSFYGDNAGGISVNVSAVSALPVPGAVWLFGSGLLGFIGIAKRKKA